jgi:hypothetical protein
MASSKKGQQVLYLVKWLNYPDRKDWTEESFHNFSAGRLEKLQEFHRWNSATVKDYRLD